MSVKMLNIMSNPLEEAGRRVEVGKEIQVHYTRIFYTAKDLLEKKGKLVKQFPLFRHRVFEDDVHPREQEVHVKIWSAADLERVNRISIEIQEIGFIEIKKKGVKGEETFSGKYAKVNSGWVLDLKGLFEIQAVPLYAEALKNVREEIMAR